MTTDDKTLTERVARVLAEVDGYGPADMHIDWVMRYYGDFAAAVLPIISKAQEDALRDAADEIEGMGVEPWNALTPAIRALRFRADEIEKEQTNG